MSQKQNARGQEHEPNSIRVDDVQCAGGVRIAETVRPTERLEPS